MKKVDFKALLKNEKVMYVVLFLTSVSAFGYLMARNLEAVTLMAAVGFLTWNFSKNMTIVLGTALLVTNMVYGVRRFEGFKEGEEPLEKPDEKKPPEKKPDEPCVGDNCPPKKAGMTNLTPARVDGEEDDQPAADVGSAYDELSKETKQAIDNQKEIKKNIEKLEPMMETLNTMIETLGMKT